MRCLFILLFAQIISFQFLVAAPLSISVKNERIDVDHTVCKLLYDHQNLFDAMNIISGKYDSLFVLDTAIKSIYPYSGKYYWIMFELNNVDTFQSEFIFEILNSFYPEVNLYHNQIKVFDQSFGSSYDFSQRQIQHKNLLYLISPKSLTASKYYLQLQVNKKSDIYFWIKPVQQFIQYSLLEYFLLGLFYGMILIMALYNLLLFFKIKEKLYYLYFFYAISVAFKTMAEDGLGFQFLWKTAPFLNDYLNIFSLFILSLSFFFYSINFLQIRIAYPFVYKLSILFLAVSLIHLLLLQFKITSIAMQYTYALPFLLLYAVSIFRMKGNPHIVYYALAFLFLILSVIVYLLRIEQIVPTSLLTVYIFNYGFLGEVILLSLATGEKMKLSERNKEIATKQYISQLQENERIKSEYALQLEDKILERTQELRLSNDALLKSNTILNEQAKTIEKVNKLLYADNLNLASGMAEQKKARAVLKEMTYKEFLEVYPDDDACIKILEQLKWADGFQCRRCKNVKALIDEHDKSRRCTKCGNFESVKSNTLFHSCKFPLTKAFYIAYLINFFEKSISSKKLSEELDLRLKTCWDFRNKAFASYQEMIRLHGKTKNSHWYQMLLIDSVL